MGLLYVTWSSEQFSSCLDPLSLKPHLPSFSSFLILWEFLEFLNSFAAFFNTKIRQTFSQINLRHSACLLLNIEILPESKVHTFIHSSILNNLKKGRLFKIGWFWQITAPDQDLHSLLPASVHISRHNHSSSSSSSSSSSIHHHHNLIIIAVVTIITIITLIAKGRDELPSCVNFPAHTGKNGHENFRQARIYNFRDKSVFCA